MTEPNEFSAIECVKLWSKLKGRSSTHDNLIRSSLSVVEPGVFQFVCSDGIRVVFPSLGYWHVFQYLVKDKNPDLIEFLRGCSSMKALEALNVGLSVIKTMDELEEDEDLFTEGDNDED